MADDPETSDDDLDDEAVTAKTSGSPDAGDPGGMGGVGASTAGSSRPPGGVSPVPANDDREED